MRVHFKLEIRIIFSTLLREITTFMTGIVGTGKSTMLGAFKNYPQMDIIPEPVGEWTNFNGTDVLNLLMTNPHRWATTQEFLAYNSMINEHLRRLGLVKAMERSIHRYNYNSTHLVEKL